MDRVVWDQLWTELKRLGKQKGKRAAVAFVSDDSAIQFGKDDALIVDASDDRISGGQTSAKVLRRAFERGAKLFHREGLHAKVYLFKDAVLIGSANCSQHSRRQGEVALISENRSVRAQVVGLIEDWSHSPSVRINKSFLRRIERIKVNRPKPEHGVFPGRKHGPPQAWIVGTDDDFEFSVKEKQLIKKAERKAKAYANTTRKIDWVFYKDQNAPVSQQARAGDLMSLVSKEKVSGKTTTYAYCPVPVLGRTPGPPGTVVCYEVPEDYEKTRMTFEEFRTLCRAVGIKKRIEPTEETDINTELANDLARAWDKQQKRDRKKHG